MDPINYMFNTRVHFYHFYKWGTVEGIIKCRDREQIKSAMANKGHSVFICLFALACFTVHANAAAPSRLVPFNRSSFPVGFVFGAGSASYQSEGAAQIDGRGPSIWDTFVRKHPEKIWDRSTGDIADDFYHHYKEDIKLMKKIGLDSFRFSISWSRILPKGNIAGGVNPLGVKFYNNVINELLLNGIKPFVTLLHYDAPQALDDKYGGFLNPKIVDDFRDYADLCFKSFGDRVKDWVTMNEPNGFAINGYNGGTFAPGRCSKTEGNCTAGDSATEPYLVTHHLLLSHAAVVQLYREKYKSTQKGQIGITVVTHWFVPKFNTPTGRLAASRAFDFFFGWYANPITFGDYPKTMRATVGNRLPKFTPEQSKMLRGSYDFLGLNYYTVKYADFMTVPNGAKPSFYIDMRINLDNEKNKRILGTPTSLNWLFIYPKGLEETLQYIKANYNNPPVILTENGLADNGSLPLNVALKDGLRIRYHSSHLSYLLKAIKDGVNVKGYYMWTFWDDFEWDAGYTVRFGMVYVDFKNNAKRYLKYSAYWFKMFLQK